MLNDLLDITSYISKNSEHKKGFITGSVYDRPQTVQRRYFDRKKNQYVNTHVTNFSLKSYHVSKKLAYIYGIPETVEFTDREGFTYIHVECWGDTLNNRLAAFHLHPGKRLLISGMFSREPAIGQDGREYPNFTIKMLEFRVKI